MVQMEIYADAAQLSLLADAHVNSAQPDVNSGTISNLNVGGGYNTYLLFDLSNPAAKPLFERAVRGNITCAPSP